MKFALIAPFTSNLRTLQKNVTGIEREQSLKHKCAKLVE